MTLRNCNFFGLGCLPGSRWGRRGLRAFEEGLGFLCWTATPWREDHEGWVQLERFRNYRGLIKVARSGFPWEKTTKGDVASVYTNCETALKSGNCSFLRLKLHLADGVPPTTAFPEAGRKLAAIKCFGTPFSAGVRFRNAMAAKPCLKYAFRNSSVYRAIQL